ncbi:hypothetical protein [Thermococcus sp.]|uniref:hypothetical protein n=1 Tax=Thermococcus sp. TaxID=35749 RepID=UPI0026030D51|nr:hypothetical protein [Thermococcus sp.]
MKSKAEEGLKKAIEEGLIEKLGWKDYMEFKSILKKLDKGKKKEFLLLLLEVKLLSAQEEVGPLLQLLGYVVH